MFSKFILNTILLFSVLTVFAQTDGGQKVNTKLIKVTNKVYMLQGKGGNIGLSFGKDGVFMIDDQYADLSNPFDDELDVPINVESLSEPKKKQAPSFNPLLRFPLSQYTVKGVITSLKGNRALITTSQGNSFYVKEGEFIGNNKGVIQEIKNNSIIIVEKDRRIEIIISSNGRVSNR